MPVYCQRCGKKFQDTARVLNHMNQPVSSCRTYYEEVLQIAEAVRHRERLVQTGTHWPKDQPHKMDHSADALGPDMIHEPMTRDEETLENMAQNFNTASSRNSPFVAEFYPGASTVFGSGATFMDNFDKDQFSEERQTHLYYPFASKDEWQMASFLLRSGLSKAAMDRFFKLELVDNGWIHFIVLDTESTFSR